MSNTRLIRLTGYEAIKRAERDNLTLCKYNDPIEAAREGLSVEEALEIAHEDPGLIYLEIDETDATVFAIIDNDGRICALYKSRESAEAEVGEYNADPFNDDGTPDTCGPYRVTTWVVQP